MTLGQAGAVLAERYQLVRLVGSAIDGEVWQGHDQRLARSVTVRLAAADPDALEDDPGVQPLITRLSQVNDPGVAAVYDVGVDGGLRYAVGEWIHGRTLGQIFATGRQPWQRAGDWGQQVGTALDSLHRVGIVHGTLTAESIAIQDDRRAKIIDLGLVARAAEDDSGDDEDGTGAGSGTGAGAGTGVSADTGGLRAVGEEKQDEYAADSGPDPAGGSVGAGGAEDRTTVLPQADRTVALPPADRTTPLPLPDRTVALPQGDRTIALPAADRTTMLPPARADAPPEAADDVYALGAVLWWAVTGVPLAYATTTSAGPDPSALREAGAPPEFTALLLRMLAADPAARPVAGAAAEQFAAVQAIPRPDDTMVGPQLIAPTQNISQVPAAAAVAAAYGAADYSGRDGSGGRDDRYSRDSRDDGSDSRRMWAIVAGVLALAVAGVLIGLLLANRHSANPNLNPSGTPLLPSGTSTSGSVVLPSAPTTAPSTGATTAPPTTAPPTTAPPTTTPPTTVPPTSAQPTATEAPTSPASTPDSTSTPSSGLL